VSGSAAYHACSLKGGIHFRREAITQPLLQLLPRWEGHIPVAERCEQVLRLLTVAHKRQGVPFVSQMK